jgi:mycothiol synthase
VTRVQWSTHLAGADVTAVDDLLNRVSDADGVSAISEHAYLHLLAGGGHDERHATIASDDGLLAYAHLSNGIEPVAEILVDPAARGRGLGGLLLDEILDQGRTVRIWAHGQLPAAQALAESRGLVAARRLCRYTRDLDTIPHRTLPEEVELRSFTAADSEDWLDLNATAFVDLPDQGGWTENDLRARLEASWFDAEGFLLAFDAAGLVGSHWTKVHGGAAHPHSATGEVYVLAVAPRARGTGLGAAMTVEGLRHLRDRGLTTVMLYVDCDNSAAVGLYRSLGFEQADCDVQYAAAPTSPDAAASGSLGS